MHRFITVRDQPKPTIPPDTKSSPFRARKDQPKPMLRSFNTVGKDVIKRIEAGYVRQHNF